VLYWLMAVISLVGVVLNIHGYRVCFVLWAISNATWAVADYRHGLPQQAALQAVYFLLSLYGIWKWSRPRGQTGSAPSTVERAR
jgi:nicotinamide riboside transporter PnuC